MKIKDIETSKKYKISGDLENGDINGKPYICHEEVVRAINRVTDTRIICECGREFLIKKT